ncbi:3-dehydroquinate synthase [Candidatus Synechococcus calcipolaris G9]|uniref:3-dehydroquinate synthase n=1 Tax=Candidatus Synechococcus calcipolaris G9 TaxID=1497997 RepID=A0ABT6F256_9SYNE|nr:3-dehydroquinate synthase [Candidatus Synechococcus calcipolaris]MDG2991895.1 3-dehydroquinate synthase [Candidatus Synechococcus calcipolaris G9]
MVVIPVKLPSQSYEVVIAAGGRYQVGSYLEKLSNIASDVPLLIVSNPKIWQLYGQDIQLALKKAGFKSAHCVLPAGERYKTLKTLQKIYDAALAHRLERRSTLIALGGGVIGDMTGFAAATWLRGINVVQIPTSLLAMVDASIGGKTGVNHPQGKNLIGAFHQPRLVLIDPDVLKTLPRREFRAAIAEVIKYGVIWDPQLFSQLEALPRLDDHRYISPEQLLEILERSCQAKVDVVTKDEREAGLRAILNYGHTLGHALESIGNYRLFNHGEAVALGMIGAGAIATALGYWSEAEEAAQLQLIQKAKLPTSISAKLDHSDIMTLLSSDKKVQGGQIRFVLPKGIGQAEITDQVPQDIIAQALAKLCSVVAT